MHVPDEVGVSEPDDNEQPAVPAAVNAYDTEPVPDPPIVPSVNDVP